MNTIYRRAVLAALLFFTGNLLISKTFDIRALWIVRDHIINKEKINNLLEFADQNNYNHLFVQIRGRGDAYYSSKVVPRAHLLSDSKFDPLEYIIQKSKNTK